MERIFKAAKEFGFEILISPQYIFTPPTKGGSSMERSRPTRARQALFVDLYRGAVQIDDGTTIPSDIL